MPGSPPRYLSPEALTLQEERPFHHRAVHGPGRFFPRFLALRTGGGAGAEPSLPGAFPSPRPPTRTPRWRRVGADEPEGRGRGFQVSPTAQLQTSAHPSGEHKWLQREKPGYRPSGPGTRVRGCV